MLNYPDPLDDLCGIRQPRVRQRGLMFWAGVVACIAFIGLVFVKCAKAEWKPEYENVAPEIRAWYRNAELTDAAKERFPFKKCCDHADVVKTRFDVNRTSHGDEWFYLVPETNQWKRIPPDIIHWGVSAPGGAPTLFVFKGDETCFFPGDSGI